MNPMFDDVPIRHGFNVATSWREPLQSENHGWRPGVDGKCAARLDAHEDVRRPRVHALSVSYGNQEQEPIDKGTFLFGDKALTPIESRLVNLEGKSCREIVATDAGGDDRVIWLFYEVEDQSFTTPLRSQSWHRTDSLTRQPHFTRFAVRSGSTPSCDTPRDTLATFMHDSSPQPAAPWGDPTAAALCQAAL